MAACRPIRRVPALGCSIRLELPRHSRKGLDGNLTWSIPLNHKYFYDVFLLLDKATWINRLLAESGKNMKSFRGPDCI
jgi:hypothetical protein